jgi:hypothetical protein
VCSIAKSAWRIKECRDNRKEIMSLPKTESEVISHLIRLGIQGKTRDVELLALTWIRRLKASGREAEAKELYRMMLDNGYDAAKHIFRR